MAASYPTSTKAFSTKTNGQQIAASHVDELQDEVVAIETDLRAGLPVTRGGTGATTLAAHGVVIANGTSAVAVTGAGTSGQVLTSNGTGADPTFQALFAVVLQEFRLSLTTALSVTTADVTAATTLYFTPHVGRRCTTFDASGNATTLTSAEISIAVPATTSQMYDVFCYSNAGVLTLELLAWTNDTTRATAIVKTGAIDAAGIWTKSGDTTRRYVGSFRTTAVSGQTEDSAAKRFLYNYYHRVLRPMRVLDTTDSWAYTTAAYRQARGSTANQLAIVQGVAEDGISVTALGTASNSGASANMLTSIGEDATNAKGANVINVGGFTGAGAGVLVMAWARCEAIPAVGYHFYAWLEYDLVAAGTTTWFGDNGGVLFQTGIMGMWRS